MGRFFYMPETVATGAGSLEDCREKIVKGRKALIVTGNTVKNQPCMEKLLKILLQENCKYSIFSDTPGEPDDIIVEAGFKKYMMTECDFMIAVGGGTPIDIMKAIAVRIKYNDNKLRDFQGKVIEGPFVPMVAIPTTAGTGSETTMFTVITDTETQVKMLLKGPMLIPDLAIIDPEFSVSAPASVTANTGLDAFCHAAESYTSRLAQPMTDMMALEAVKNIFEYLPKAFSDGNDLVARDKLALAAFEAGVCITNASVTLIHGLSRPIGALFHVPHGLSNAMLLPACFEFALDGAYSRFAALGRYAGVARSEDDKAAAEEFLAAVKELCSKVKIQSLSEYGVDKEEFFKAIPKMARDAVASGSPGNTFKAVTEADAAEIYKKLWD